MIKVTPELKKLAIRFGYIPLIAYRDTRDEALHELITRIETYDDKVATKIALSVALNTIALERAHEACIVTELRELARATEAYCLQDSRSERRRQAMISGCKLALTHAQNTFGDEA